MANVLILGGGFGGLVAAERLGTLVGREHQVTLVAPNKRFTFYPALVHLAFGDCEEEDITFDMQAKLASSGIRFVQGKVSTVDPAKRTVHITGDDFSGDLAFDHILFAMGRRLAAERVPGFFDHAHHLLGIGAAQRFGERVREFREGTIIVGASPDSRLPVPVCETAFALARRFATEMRAGTVHVKVVFPESLQAAFGGAVLHEELESAFRRHGINVLYDVPVSEVTGRQVRSLHPSITIFVLCLASALLSALMSNTATVVMLIPLASALVPGPSTAVLMAISASFGMTFLISTPPNAMAHGEGVRSSDLFYPGLAIMLLGCILVSLTGRFILNFAGIP